jgi:transposase
MFVWSAATRIYLALGATDLRQGFDGLYALVRQRLEWDPASGHVFVFAIRRRSRVKLLFWDGSGLWLCAKRPERGRVRWPPCWIDAFAARPTNGWPNTYATSS